MNKTALAADITEVLIRHLNSKERRQRRTHSG